MKRIFFVTAFLLLTSAFAFSQQKNPKLEATLVEMDKTWTAAEIRGDMKAVSAYIADDYWGTTPDGKLQNKTQYMADIKATKDTDVADQYSVRFFGPDLAVMTHRGTVKGENNLQYRSTHVWVNRGGKWQIAAHHSSEIAADAAKTDAAKADVASPAAATPTARKAPKIAPLSATPAADGAKQQ